MNQSKSSNNYRSARRGPNPKNAKKPVSKVSRAKGNKSQNRDDDLKIVNIAQSRSFMNSAPKTTYQPNGDIVIRHREYISDVTSSNGTFAVTAYPVNPGLPGSFPWLSTVARSFESYLFEQLDFRYETQAPSTGTGTIILALDYDASDAAPTSKTQALAYESSVRSAVWVDSDHRSLKKNLTKQKSFYIRNGALSANQDVKLYDVGNMFVCTQNTSGAAGELYVDYTVRLMTPQLGPAGVGDAVFGTFVGTSNAAPFATSSGNLPATVVSSGTTTSVSTFTFTQPWEGYVTVILVGTGLTSIAPSGTGAEVEINDVYDATAIEAWSFNSIVEDVGNTFIITIANTTISLAQIYFAQADV